MNNTYYYLDQEGLEKLIDYIHIALNKKVDKESISKLLEDFVKKEDLNDYALLTDLTDYAKTENIQSITQNELDKIIYNN